MPNGMPDFLVNMPVFTSAPRREDYLGKANAFNGILDSLGSMDPEDNSILYNLDKGVRDQHDQEIADFVSTLSNDELNSIMNTYGSVEKYLRDRYYDQGIYHKNNLDKLAQNTQTKLKTSNDLEFERWASNLKYNPTEARALRESGLSPSQFFARAKGLSDKAVAEQNDKVDAAWATIQDSLYKEDTRDVLRQMGNTFNGDLLAGQDPYVANKAREEFRQNLVKQINIATKREIQDLLVNDPAAITPERRNAIAQQIISQLDPKNEFGINASDLQESMNADFTDPTTYTNYTTMGEKAKEIAESSFIDEINANPDKVISVIKEGPGAIDKLIKSNPRYKNLDTNNPKLRASIYNSIIQRNNGFLFTTEGKSLDEGSENYEIMLDKFKKLVEKGDVLGMQNFINKAAEDSASAIERYKTLLRNSKESEDVIAEVMNKAKANQSDVLQFFKDKMSSVVDSSLDSLASKQDAFLENLGATQVSRDAFYDFNLANANSKEPTVAMDYGKTGKKSLKETFETIRDYVVNEADNDIGWDGFGNTGFGNRTKKQLINLFDKIDKADPLVKAYALTILAHSIKKEKGYDYAYMSKAKENILSSDELEDIGSDAIGTVEKLVSYNSEDTRKEVKDNLNSMMYLSKLNESKKK